MASKKRGGLSKREFATKQKSIVKKSPVRPKSIAPLVGAGPLQTGQVRAGSTVTGAGPLLPGQSRDNSYKGDSKQKQREQASKALPLVKTASAKTLGDGTGTISANTDPGPGKTGRNILGGILSMGKQGLGMMNPGLSALFQNTDLGVSERLGLNKYFKEDTGYETPQIFGIDAPALDYAPPEIRGREDVVDTPDSPMTPPPFSGNRGTNFPENLSPEQQESRRKYQSVIDSGRDSSYDAEMRDTEEALRQRQNELFGGDQITDTPSATIPNRSGRGSGLYATGKGVGNPADGDPYLAELRKSMKGYSSMEKDIRKQFEDMIKSLDPTYDQYSADIKASVDKELADNLNKLMAVMIANNTADSEQRAQMMSRQQTDAAATLGDLLRKLMLQKNEDIQGYKEKQIGSINQVRDKKLSAREKIAQMMREAQQKQMAPVRVASTRKTTSPAAPRVAESDIYRVQQELGVSRTQAKALLEEEAGL